MRGRFPPRFAPPLGTSGGGPPGRAAGEGFPGGLLGGGVPVRDVWRWPDLLGAGWQARVPLGAGRRTLRLPALAQELAGLSHVGLRRAGGLQAWSLQLVRQTLCLPSSAQDLA